MFHISISCFEPPLFLSSSVNVDSCIWYIASFHLALNFCIFSFWFSFNSQAKCFHNSVLLLLQNNDKERKKSKSIFFFSILFNFFFNKTTDEEFHSSFFFLSFLHYLPIFICLYCIELCIFSSNLSFFLLLIFAVSIHSAKHEFYYVIR